MLSRLKIAGRLRAGFLTLNIVIFGLNAYTFVATREIQNKLEGSIRAASNQAKMLTFLEEAFRMRAHAWSSYGTGEEKRWNDSLASAQKAQGLLTELKKSTLDPERTQRLERMEKNWNAYQAAMKGIRDLGGQNPELLKPEAAPVFKAAAEARKGLDDEGEALVGLYAEALSGRSSTMAETITEMNDYSIIIGIVCLLLGVVLAYVISRSIATPIKKMTGVMEELVQGHLDVEVPSLNQHDEIGEMAQSVEVFKQNAKQVEGMRHSQEEAAARSAQERRQALEQMADQFERDVLGVVNTVTSSADEMHGVAQNLATTSQQLSKDATGVAAASTQTTSSVNTVAAAAEELSASIGDITRQVAQSASVAGTASAEAHRTNGLIQELSTASEQIGSVISLISDIAEQTNLLALNATIEAARAGDAGKGFSVVASEVKSLANQTSKATQEISEQITTIQAKTKHAVEAIQNIKGIVDQVQDISSSISSSVEQQGTATREIAQSIQQAAQGTQEVSSLIDGVTQVASDSGHEAKTALTSAEDLAENAASLKIKVETFIRQIRGEKRA